MRVLGICGSPRRKESTTRYALSQALSAVQEADSRIEIDLLELSLFSYSGCRGCDTRCRETLDCAIQDDFTRHLIPLLKEEGLNGLILGSPVYFGSVTAQMKAFMDRSVVFRRNGFGLSHLAAGVLTVGKSRHGGQELAALDLIKYALIQGMVVVPDAPPTSHFGGLLWSGGKQGIERDHTGLESARNLGRNIARVVAGLSPDCSSASS